MVEPAVVGFMATEHPEKKERKNPPPAAALWPFLLSIKKSLVGPGFDEQWQNPLPSQPKTRASAAAAAKTHSTQLYVYCTARV